MVTSVKQFHIELYKEHLEEASFLFEQRNAYFRDPELTWLDISEWEQRFEAQLDAMVVGSGLALDVCRERATEGDAGEIHTALSVFCRQRRMSDVFDVLSTLDADDEEVILGATQALCYEAPTAWRDDLLRILQGKQTHLTALLASVAGYRRFRCADILNKKLATSPDRGTAELAWAIGRVGTSDSAQYLWPLLDSEDERCCEAAAIALLRLGDSRPLQRAMLTGQLHSWPRRVLSVGGNSKAVNILLDILKSSSIDESTVLGLGLLGDLAAVGPLVQLLENEEWSESAAVALNTITGAGLHSEVFVPDDMDVNDLFEDEREIYEKEGKLPTRVNGEPYGSWEHRPMCEISEWRAWLSNNKNRFSRDHRWRMGRPYGPIALFECLQSVNTPFAIRAATYEEFVIRYGLDVPFEVDLPVRQQVKFLQSIEKWVAGRSQEFVDGGWYFAGRPQA